MLKIGLRISSGLQSLPLIDCDDPIWLSYLFGSFPLSFSLFHSPTFLSYLMAWHFLLRRIIIPLSLSSLYASLSSTFSLLQQFPFGVRSFYLLSLLSFILYLQCSFILATPDVISLCIFMIIFCFCLFSLLSHCINNYFSFFHYSFLSAFFIQIYSFGSHLFSFLSLFLLL